MQHATRRRYFIRWLYPVLPMGPRWQGLSLRIRGALMNIEATGLMRTELPDFTKTPRAARKAAFTSDRNIFNIKKSVEFKAKPDTKPQASW